METDNFDISLDGIAVSVLAWPVWTDAHEAIVLLVDVDGRRVDTEDGAETRTLLLGDDTEAVNVEREGFLFVLVEQVADSTLLFEESVDEVVE